MLPIIGLTCSLEDDRYYQTVYYCNGILRAGGIPLIIPYVYQKKVIANYLDLLDALILTGGVDPDPVYFGEEPHIELGRICPERDKFELMLLNAFLQTTKPILGICRGMQILNIVVGGTLWQDIRENKEYLQKHEQNAPKWYPSHEVSINENTKLLNIYGNKRKIRVNSFHHQAVKDVPMGFKIAATSSDGLIEAIESNGELLRIGVQWHPECLWQKDSMHLNLFKALIAAVKKG